MVVPCWPNASSLLCSLQARLKPSSVHLYPSVLPMRRANSVCGICKNPRRARLHPQTTTFPSAKWVGCCVSAHVSNKTLMNNHLVKSCGYDIIVSFLHPPIYSFVTFLLFTFLTLCKSILKSSNHICKSAIKPIIKVPNPSNGRALCS